MVVGDDVAVRVQDDARASGPHRAACPLVEEALEEIFERALVGASLGLRGGWRFGVELGADVDDRGLGLSAEAHPVRHLHLRGLSGGALFGPQRRLRTAREALA